MTFDYLLEKIRNADFSEYPFKHIYIDDFFSPEHLTEIINSDEINLSRASSDGDLFDKLFAAGYKIIDFPGCVTDKKLYIKWHQDRRLERTVTNTACEGFGMTLRLMSPRTPIITELREFLVGETFRETLAEKFAIDMDDVFPDMGIQKYLDGYEISPHPDIRKKALTYMVNINPHGDAETLDHHTHYLKFKDEYKYVQAFWEGNPKQDRCWVPWDWCETESQQTKNNSIVIFSPSNDTVHGVKTNYDHLSAQRTQLYGNLWYHKVALDGEPGWEDFAGVVKLAERKMTTVDSLKALIPQQAKEFVKSAVIKKDNTVIKNRLEMK